MHASTGGMVGWKGSPLLEAVGHTLDRGLECAAYEGGFVWPAPELVPKEVAGMLEGVIADGAQQEGGAAGAEGPAAGPWTWPAAGDSPQRTAAAGTGSSVVRRVRTAVAATELCSVVVKESALVQALERYPQFGISGVAGEVRLFGRIQPIADLRVAAFLAVRIPLDRPGEVRAWAWWEDGIWIGPRHTYGDGSVCAFEIPDGTWHPERGFDLLMNLHSVWIARQTYLRVYGRWPGLQRIHSPLERVSEHQRGEFCGCGAALTYENCHYSYDLRRVKPEQIRLRREQLLRRGFKASGAPA